MGHRKDYPAPVSYFLLGSLTHWRPYILMAHLMGQQVGSQEGQVEWAGC